ncbi:hypothetical protein DL95DRAFT_414975 [Leptodontidium sp. 2 PMI_412]|nr:hypothetical protein DL95DRAFT_414975 [Leptodontidium sp. 2 PMI_412]
MPTATSISGWSLLNVGPATTTFTEPASCATAYRTVIAPATDPALPLWNVHCPWVPPADCNPSGSIVQSIISSAEGTNPTDGLFIVYQSPGLVCPSGQATVGAAEKPNPTSISVSGAFNLSDAIPTGGSYTVFFEPPLDVFLAALDPGETAILCCPSSYTPGNGGCYSTLPSSAFTPTTGCGKEGPEANYGTVNGTWTIGGQTITGGLLTITGTIPMSAVTTSFAPSEVTSYVGVALEGMGILVHQSSDIVTASATSSAASSTASSTTSGTSKPNSALRVKGNGDMQGVVIAIWCLFFILGARLVV